jgi:hypothetical protein
MPLSAADDPDKEDSMPLDFADVPSRSLPNFDVADDASAMPLLNGPLTATSVTFTV